MFQNPHTTPRRRLLLAGIGLVLGTVAVQAGGLTPPGAPDDDNSALFTLQDLFDRLDDGSAGTKRGAGFAEPDSGPTTGTMVTLDAIMGMMPAVDESNGAAAANVLEGKTFWGLTSSGWGPRIGTAAAGSNVTGADGAISFDIPNGIYSGDKTCIANDSDLTAGNVKSGVGIFNVTGTYSCTEPTGDATAADVLTDKTFSNASGIDQSGSMPDKEGDNASTGQAYPAVGPIKLTAPTGFYDGDDTVTATESQVATLDADLTAGNVKKDAEIFGITGTYETPPCNCDCVDCSLTGTRWCDNGNGTVTDLLGATVDGKTKGRCLVWLKNAGWGGLEAWRQNTVGGYDDAHTRAGLLASGAAGSDLTDGSVVGDWRLPTLSELTALTKDPQRILSGSPGPFSGVQTEGYWSSTSYADNTGGALNLNFNLGFVNVGVKTSTYYVWPVRGGQ